MKKPLQWGGARKLTSDGHGFIGRKNAYKWAKRKAGERDGFEQQGNEENEGRRKTNRELKRRNANGKGKKTFSRNGRKGCKGRSKAKG